MDQTRLNLLRDKYRKGQLNQQEAQELDDWFHSLNLTDNDFDEWIAEEGGQGGMADKLFHNFKGRLTNSQKQTKILRLKWSAAAASILIILSAGTVYFLKQKNIHQQTAQNQTKDIAPGHNQATLILANGHKIILTKGLSGKLAQQGNTLIGINAVGAVAYITGQGENTKAITYNTMSTARGEESPYPLVLADGTKVWLNAESSITFPATFTGSDRSVKITGEAYLEVVHNAAKPFRVIAGAQTIEDIGTHFDISAYEDEPAIKTTLLEGSVKVNYHSQSEILKPGQQAVLKSDALHVRDADTEVAIAWKNGYFMFDSESIQGLMRQLARWYDIDVDYSGNAPTQTYSGNFSRFGNISKVLEILEKTNTVHFRIEGRRVTVMK